MSRLSSTSNEIQHYFLVFFFNNVDFLSIFNFKSIFGFLINFPISVLDLRSLCFLCLEGYFLVREDSIDGSILSGSRKIFIDDLSVEGRILILFQSAS